MSKVDLTGCAARLRAVDEAWMNDFKESLRKKTWREMCKKHPGQFKIERGFVWEKNSCGVWIAISDI